MSLNENLERVISAILDCDESKVAVGLISTGEVQNAPYISYPKELRTGHRYFNVVCASTHDATEIIAAVTETVDVWFLDYEFKQSSFNRQEIIDSNPSIKFRPLFPNRITVESILDLLCELNFTNILIFGHGNIACSIADFMKSCNLGFGWVPSRISSSEKLQRMKFLFANECYFSAEKMAASADSHLNILACRRLPEMFFEESPSLKSGCIFDISGKGLTNKLPTDFSVRRLDISARLVTWLENDLTHVAVPSHGRSILPSGTPVVSGGYIGLRGDLIVDSHVQPKYVIGVADGDGGFLKKLNLKFKDYEESKP